MHQLFKVCKVFPVAFNDHFINVNIRVGKVNVRPAPHLRLLKVALMKVVEIDDSFQLLFSVKINTLPQNTVFKGKALNLLQNSWSISTPFNGFAF